MKQSVRIAAAVAAASLSIGLVAGCGGSDSSASSSAADTTAAASTTAAMTQAEFVAAADKICADVNAKVATLEDSADNSGLQGVQNIYEQALADAKAGNAELQALTPPADLAADYQAFLDAHAASQANGESLVAKIQAATTLEEAVAVVKANTDLEALAAKGKAAATKLGLAECAKD